MTDSDVLVRAARALREAHTGEREGSGFTRARIMNSVHRERRRRTLRWAILSPIASLLVVGSAWAQSSGKWPVIWQAVTSVFVAAPPAEPAQSSKPRQPPSEPGPSRAESLTDAPADAAGAADASAPVPSEPALLPQRLEPVPAPPRGRRPRLERRKARRVEAERTAPAPAEPALSESEPPASDDRERRAEPERDQELSRFRAAHDLHFADRPREAIRAYAEYLREYPGGRFVPEARYNGALDEIKLGNVAAAREALAPFAAGRYRGYRQKEARELLDALDRKPGTSR